MSAPDLIGALTNILSLPSRGLVPGTLRGVKIKSTHDLVQVKSHTLLASELGPLYISTSFSPGYLLREPEKGVS